PGCGKSQISLRANSPRRFHNILPPDSMMHQRDGSDALPDSATGVGITVSLQPRAALVTPRFACLGTMMSPGLIAISEWRTVRPKRAQPLAEPQLWGFGRVSGGHQPT